MLSPRQQLVQALQQKLQQQIAARQADGGEARVTSGSPVFDRLLQGGFRRGSLSNGWAKKGAGRLFGSAARRAVRKVGSDRRSESAIYRRMHCVREKRSGARAISSIIRQSPRSGMELTQALGVREWCGVGWRERLDERLLRFAVGSGARTGAGVGIASAGAA